MKSFSVTGDGVYVYDFLRPEELSFLQSTSLEIIPHLSRRFFGSEFRDFVQKTFALYFSRAPSEISFRKKYADELYFFNEQSYFNDCNRLLKTIVQSYVPGKPLVMHESDDSFSTEYGELLLKKELNRKGWIVQLRSLPVGEVFDYEYTLLAKNDLKNYSSIRNLFITEDQKPRFAPVSSFHRTYLKDLY